MRLWRVGFFVEPWSSAALSNAWGWNEMSPGHSIHQTHLLHWLEYALLYSPSPAHTIAHAPLACGLFCGALVVCLPSQRMGLE